MSPGPENNHGAPNLDLTQAIAEKVVKGQLGGPIQKEDWEEGLESGCNVHGQATRANQFHPHLKLEIMTLAADSVGSG